MASVFIKALHVEDNGNGTFRIDLPERELTEQERKTLDSLFPSLLGNAYKLLDQEALIQSVASESEVAAPKKSKNNYFGNNYEEVTDDVTSRMIPKAKKEKS